MGRRWVTAAMLLLAACKAELAGDGATDANNSQGDTGASAIDAGIDTQPVLGAWGTPAKVGGADTAIPEDDATLSSTQLELFFKTVNGTVIDLYVMTRATATGTFGAPQALTTLNSSVAEESPRLSADDKTIYFGRNGDIYKSTRTAVGQPWSAPSIVTALNTASYEKWADVCDNGYAIVSRDLGAGNGQDMYEGTITGGAPTPITAFNTTSAEQGTLLSADCLHVYFQSNRDGEFNLYEASRTSVSAAWSNPTKLPDFNTATFSEEDPWISTDQRVFMFASDSSGNKDVYISTR